MIALEMAKDHVLWLQAWGVQRGISLAFGDIPKEAFRALCADEEAASEAYERYQAYRQIDKHAD
jgi:hypothetical protein